MPGEILLGAQVEAMDDAELAEVADAHHRVRQAHARRRRSGSCARCTARATWSASSATASTTARRCKAADVGISVDTAVDIAKESADIILLEKSLMVLEEGVIEGRKIFGNIIKYIKMGASSNFGNMFSVLGASAVPAVPADGADPGADQQPALRLLADRDPDRQRGRGVPRGAAPLGHRQHLQVHGVHRADQLDLRLRDLRA